MPLQVLIPILVMWVVMKLVASAVDGLSGTLAMEPAFQDLEEGIFLRSFVLDLTRDGVPLLGFLLDRVGLDVSLEIPYPALHIWGGVVKDLLLWDYPWLMTGPLEPVRYLLLAFSLAFVFAIVDLLLRFIAAVGSVIPG